MLKELKLDMLSEREREILDSAIEGMTDQQIANRMGISASTVNSYWVRIRGKLGQLSRTELVSKIVQHRANLETTSLGRTIRDLEQELTVAKQRALNSEKADLCSAALDLNPEALVVFDDHGRIVLANPRFEHLFGLSAGGGVHVCIQQLFSDGVPNGKTLDPEDLRNNFRIGVSKPLYGKRNRQLFRLILLISKGELQGNPIYSCVVRTFNDEMAIAQDRAAVVMAELKAASRPTS
jgi:DNA-binding CsgD family transcriptional regulator